MHALTVLAEIIRTRPYLVLFGAILCFAAVAFIRYILRSNVVDTFLMSFQVVFGAESFGPSAVAFTALKRFCVPNFVLSEDECQLSRFWRKKDDIHTSDPTRS